MNEDRFDNHGHFKIFKNVTLPGKRKARQGLKKMSMGDSLKCDSQSEVGRVYSMARYYGWKVRQYKTGQGFWWVQRIA